MDGSCTIFNPIHIEYAFGVIRPVPHPSARKLLLAVTVVEAEAVMQQRLLHYYLRTVSPKEWISAQESTGILEHAVAASILTFRPRLDSDGKSITQLVADIEASLKLCS